MVNALFVMYVLRVILTAVNIFVANVSITCICYESLKNRCLN